MEYLELSNGRQIPAIGLGPGIFTPKVKVPRHMKSPYGIGLRLYNRFIGRPHSAAQWVDSIATGIRLGFRLIDYSETYGSLPLFRKAIEESGVPREELFLTTRVGNHQQMKGVSEVRESFLRGMEELGLDYYDFLQFHWPVTDCYSETWQEMIKLRDEGLVKTLGVANCHQHHLEKLHEISGEWPVVNQVEIHPLFTQKPLIEYCTDRGITMQAYTPIARYDDRLIRLPKLKQIAAHHGKSLIQIVLRWHVQNGIVPIVRSLNKKHQKENLDIFDFELSDEEMMAIDGININSRLRYDPDNCDFNIL